MNVLPLGFLIGTPGSGELLILFLVILLLFGPRRLPDIARTIGKIAEELRRASQDFRDQIMKISESDASENDRKHLAINVDSTDEPECCNEPKHKQSDTDSVDAEKDEFQE
ncbi:MAG: twin-arginine translocase TatA/TatE family subunit [Lentisphaerae bacterium]|nr:twin-arginine translocase TatA/TatE family subunit [Lentisphaerota bacterium]